jgi:hypothetical protein
MSDSVDLRKYCQQPSLRPTRKGRSESRLLVRDMKLVARFYYYAQIKNLNYSSILAKLSEEFDIDENVVRARMKLRQENLDDLFKERPTIQILRKRYPYYSW